MKTPLSEEGNLEVAVREDSHIDDSFSVGAASEQAAVEKSSIEEGEPAKDVTAKDDAKKAKEVVDPR